MNSRIVETGAKALILDGTLAGYGPEAKGAREGLRRSVEYMLRLLWPSEATGVLRVAAIERASQIENLQGALRALTPGTDTQRQLLAQAQRLVGGVAESRWMIIEEGQSHLPATLIVVLVLWLALLFASFGLFAPRNVTVIVVLFLSACSIAGAIFLVLEMSHPLDGFIKVSSAPVHSALRHLAR